MWNVLSVFSLMALGILFLANFLVEGDEGSTFFGAVITVVPFLCIGHFIGLW
jgi:hypothetical protein